MTIKIEIASKDVDINSGTAKSGNPYTIRKQTAYIHTGDKYPEKFVIRLGDEQAPYDLGMYTLDPKSFYIGQYDALSINPVLTPIK